MTNYEEHLRNSNLEFIDEITYDLICSKCSQVMILAHAASCGCSYCYNCVISVINETPNSTCINNGKKCKKTILNLNINVFQNFATIKKIEQLQIKCLNKGCDDVIKLNEIVQHFDVCLFGEVICPFDKFGCVETKVLRQNIVEHMQGKSVEHSTMLLQHMEKMTNDLRNSLRDNIEQVKTEMNTKYDEVTLSIDALSNQFTTLNVDVQRSKQLNDSRREQIIRLNRKIEFERKKNNDVLGEIDKLVLKNKEIQNNEWDKFDKITLEINKMRDELNLERRKNEEIEKFRKQEILDIKSEFEKQKKKHKEVEDNLKKEIRSLKLKLSADMKNEQIEAQSNSMVISNYKKELKSNEINKWKCSKCSYFNPSHSKRCCACGNKSIVSQPSSINNEYYPSQFSSLSRSSIYSMNNNTNKSKFLWTISKWKEKLKETSNKLDIKSNEFYLKNYLMQLNLSIYFDRKIITISFRTLSNDDDDDDDDDSSWPCTLNFKCKIDGVYKVVIFKYNESELFGRNKNDSNYSISSKICSLSRLENKHDIKIKFYV